MPDTRMQLCFHYEENEKDPELFFNEDGELQELAEWSPERLQALWDKALEVFPKDLDYTSIAQGYPPEDIEADALGYIQEELEYSEEYIFEAGTLGDSRLMAGGWIDMRMNPRYDDKPSISAMFGVALDGNWHDKNSRVLGEYQMLQTYFDIETETWDDLRIESI